MSDKRERALKVFQIISNAFEQEDWHVDKDEEELSFSCGAQGDDFPIRLRLYVQEKPETILLLSNMPFKINEDKRVELAVAICSANNGLVNGCFDYDISDGSIIFKMTNSYMGCEITEEVIKYMLYCACGTIDDYNDKFFMLSKGVLSVEDFLATKDE